MVIGVLIILVAIWVIVSEQMSGASADATINARLVTLRSPVAGEVEMPQRGFGSRVTEGEVIATVQDPLVDEVRLDDLAMERKIAAAAIQRLQALQAETVAVMDRLESRSARFSTERVAELEVRLDAARERLAILEEGEIPENLTADLSLAQDEGGNRQPLEPRLPELWVNYARERVETLEIALQAAKDGVFLGDGYNDAPNAEQRFVELQSELAAQEAELAQAEARLAIVTSRETAERRRVNRFGGAELVSPVRGLYWEVLAADGEDIQRGDAVVRLLDCDSTIVTLSVTESVFNRLSIGDTAVFRPRGDRETYDGTVERLAGSGAATIYTNLAVAPSQLHLERHDVTLSVPGLRDNAALDCKVGRTGRVFFDTRPLDRLRDLLP
jgi:multidrug resistance efflux pump